MSETFKQGDTVYWGASAYVVDAGPFNGAVELFYVVRRRFTTFCDVAPASKLKRPAPAFEEGGTADWLGQRVTLIAGPFINTYAGPWWAVKYSSGNTDDARQHELTDYQPPAPAPEVFEYDGVAYEVGATYVDMRGHRVTLVKRPANEHDARCWRFGNCGAAYYGGTAHLLEHYGPLTRKVES